MAKGAAAELQLNIIRIRNFLNFTRAFLRRNNPLKNFVNNAVSYVKEIKSLKKKMKQIQYRINYERYKLKKTELILAQNSEHLFLKGRQINQIR